MDFKKIVLKAKDFARNNPDKVRDGLDKVGTFVNSKTGGKHADKIVKGKDALGKALGLPPTIRPDK